MHQFDALFALSLYCSELLGIEESWIRPSTREGRWQGKMARLFQKLGGIQMGRSSDLTAEERAEIVLALLRREEPMSILSKRYGVSETTLGRWRDDFVAAGTEGLASGKRRKPDEARRVELLEAAVVERELVIGELTIANRILKKKRRPKSLAVSSHSVME